MACLLRQRAPAGNSWIAKRLTIGHSRSVSRLMTAADKHASSMSEAKDPDHLLKCET
jgi:hypothetical protein